jgi:hypothetical protein
MTESVEVAPMFNARADCCTIINISSNEIYVIGGWVHENDIASCEKYIIEKNLWVELPSLNEAKNTASAIFLNNSYLYVFGGDCSVSNDPSFSY